MTRMTFSAGAVAIACTAALAAQQQPFRSTIEGVAIQASVRAGNRPVVGLTAQDFLLRDDGVPQQITAVSAEKLPLDLTLLLDSSASVDGAMLQRLKSGIDDTVALLRPEDRVRLIAVSQVFQVFDFRPKGQSIPLEGLVAQGATSLYDALATGMMRISEPGRRQLVIAFTDGRDSTSILDDTTTRQIARLTDAVVDIVIPLDKDEQPPDHPVTNMSGLRRPIDSVLQPSSNLVTGSPTEMADRARDLKPWAKKDALTAVLADLITPTTGQVFTLRPGESISRAFRQGLEDFRASYVIEYAPSGVTKAGWHDVTVTVTKPGRYDVRARKGYQGE